MFCECQRQTYDNALNRTVSADLFTCDVQMHIQQHIRISFLTCSNSTTALVCQGFVILLIDSRVSQEGCLLPLVVQTLQSTNTLHFF